MKGMSRQAEDTEDIGAEPSPERVALVTGSSGGIGRAVVARFDDDGWTVVGADRDEPDDASPHRFVQADLSREVEIGRLVESIEATEGRLDALVNCAAVQICASIEDLEAEDWDRLMAVNLRAPFLCLRESLPLLRADGGAVVNISSVHAEHTSPEMSAYAGAKGGVEAFTRAAAVELAGDGIRVNSVLPGAVDTEMLRRGLERDHLSGGSDDPVEAFGRQQVMGRVARAEEVAEAVLFLADGRRASYVTGASLLVDGGVAARLSSE